MMDKLFSLKASRPHNCKSRAMSSHIFLKNGIHSTWHSTKGFNFNSPQLHRNGILIFHVVSKLLKMILFTRFWKTQLNLKISFRKVFVNDNLFCMPRYFSKITLTEDTFYTFSENSTQLQNRYPILKRRS